MVRKFHFPALYALFFCISLLVMSNISCSSPVVRTNTEKALAILPATRLSPKDFAVQKLVENGVSQKFIQRIIGTDLNQKIINFNILGFLSHADYSVHYNASAIKRCRDFEKKYFHFLRRVEKKYGVSKESIVSLLWVETKFGKHTGTFSLPEVYFSLLQADHPLVAKNTISELLSREPAAISENPQFTDESLQNKVVERSIKKAAWALTQLKVMDHIILTQDSSILNLKSSYAGAFGFPQFIPSTYQDFAVTSRHPFPDLFRISDAILSVANFLQQKGWTETNSETKSKALYEYNHSKDYGDVILKIAAQLKQKNAN